MPILLQISICPCQDFQVAFKMFCKNNQNDVAQKLKEMTGINKHQITLEKNI